MRICVDGGGYVAAATAFADANQLVALHHDTLARKLDGYAAMAGDDATASEFAQAYDDAAEAALGALVDLTASFASLSRLTTASLDNHGRAEAASVIAGATVYDGSALGDGALVSVLPTTPPSSLGGDPPALSDKENWVLDHVESFTWPNADTDRLRDAAHTWRGAAEAVDRLTDHCIAASGGFHSERSPEIPLALDAVADVRSTIADLAAQLASLADACDEYAAHVDAQRAELKALLAEILQMVVEGVVISVAISIITGGAGTVIAGGAVVARVAAQSPRFAAIIRTLAALASASASRVRAARDGVVLARARLDKFLRVPSRSDAGYFRLLPTRWDVGYLRKHEGPGHPIARHVGISREQAMARFAGRRNIKLSSTFRDLRTAETEILKVVRKNEDHISAWTETSEKTLKLQEPASGSIGVCLNRAGDEITPRYVRVILERDPSMPDGFFIKTAFPDA